MTPTYEIYAIRYAWRDARRHEHFIGGDPHDAPMPMDYFVWTAIGGGRSFVIDTGFTEEVAKRRKRNWLRCPAESLKLIGLDPETVKDVILTHLHYDHVGSFHKFPKAEFHLQEPEMHYACGRFMRFPKLAHSFEPDDIAGMVKLNFKGRVRFYNGQAEIAPGVSLHLMRGHSAGLQCVKVNTARGPVVLASDVTHFYENMEAGRPFSTAFHVGEMLEGFETLAALAPSPRHIVPGHDPEVMRRYPAAAGLEGIAVRLDLEPSA
ncbi:N-acyl homoserine lactonase family protein [Siccirubricoccus sp. G192]|uniref:N-acyl homoserine lactonase family protein n=1 Tax=Siccirubricoccus sp. G192 TaxID=2849651 RepID=UPI001C2BC5F5|nr:N-acyl homoserine lactonase family protein [Siccirubricoccus sp. G192]MBV1797920.1 N-acyl homoserine lactonase family protein [Siccirubricoccus sp. G192]